MIQFDPNSPEHKRFFGDEAVANFRASMATARTAPESPSERDQLTALQRIDYFVGLLPLTHEEFDRQFGTGGLCGEQPSPVVGHQCSNVDK